MQNSISNIPTFYTYFHTLQDPRRTSKGNYLYPFIEILFLCVSAVISGADSWTLISEFGKSKIKWLRKFFPYTNGIPSHDVLGKLFARLDHEEFSKSFSNWISAISDYTQGKVVGIDGKTIRGSNKTNSFKSAFHVVSAYVSENRLCLSQRVVKEKSNEITAIPELLKLLEIEGCIVTIDAMGCQKQIAKEIVNKQADYLLQVKGNQAGLKEQIQKVFETTNIAQTYTDTDSGHGRVEKRTCDVITDLKFLDDKEQWTNLRSIVRIRSERYDKKTSKTSFETRYYISSLSGDAKKINEAIRKHWSIENNLHWSLDVIFNEDASLKKKGNSAINFNIILKMALAMLEKETSKKISKPAKRLRAALDDNYRLKILNF